MRRGTQTALMALATAGWLLALAGNAWAIADPRDRGPLYETINALMQFAAPGRSMDWNNPVTGNRGSVTAVRQANQGGQKCWDFVRTFTLNGRVQEVNGLACEIERGLWSIVSEGQAKPKGGGATTTSKPAAPAYDPALVRDTQALLTSLGYRPGPVDGAYGPNTKNALQDYQRDRGLPATGVPTWPLVSQLRQEVAALNPPSPTPSPTPAPGPTPAPTPTPEPGPSQTAQDDAPRWDQPPDETPATQPEEQAAGISDYCDEVISQSTSTQAGNQPSAVLPLQFCLVNSEFVRASTAAPDEAESVCDLYDGEHETILAQARGKDRNALQTYLTARYGAESVRADHAKNGAACVRKAHREDDVTAATYFALLMVGAGESGFAELVAGHYALGFGLPGNLQAATDWMTAAETAVQGGAAPVVNYHGIERGPLLRLMVEELAGKLQTKTAYAGRPLADGGGSGTGAAGTTSAADGGGTPRTVPGGPSAEAVETASELLSYERDEITKTYSNFEAILGADAARIEEGCLADKSAAVKAHESGAATIENIVAQAGPSQNLLLTTAFCRAVSYRANDPSGMFYYDYMNYALGKPESAQNISYHYIVGNGVAPSREKAFDWLTRAIKSSEDAYAKETIAELMSVL